MRPGLVTASAAEVDFFTANAQGGVATTGNTALRLLQNGFDVSGLRTLDVLRKEEWKIFDDALIEVAKERLIITGDLIGRGLTYNLPNALGKTILEWEQVSDIDPAEVSMAGVTRAQRDRQTYTLKSMPLPLVHKEFRFNIRALQASRDKGETIDTTALRLATRRVAEKIESIIFNGAGVTVGGASVQGILTATNRNTGSLTAAWDGTATGEQVLGDVIAMIAKAIADNMFGPYMLYVPVAWENQMLEDFKANSDKSVISRLLEIPSIVGIRGTTNLTNAVVMIQLTSDVIDIIDGLQPTVVMWEEQGGFEVFFKVFAIMVPRVKDDAALQSGIVHYT